MKKTVAKVQFNLTHHCTVEPGSKILVGVSGGADSVVLLNILLQSGHHCQAAHCNFHLRGAESDRDEAFVRQLCLDRDVTLHVIHFDTETLARRQGISIEMAARHLRYNWFASLIKENNLDFIAIGHHADDSVETFFLNLTRGTGARGLSGIKYRNNNIIRPMLNLSRAEIEKFCTENKLKFVTDSTNAEEQYLRNRIRHSVVPVLKGINPAFLETMHATMERMMEVSQLITDTTEAFRQEAVATDGNNILISGKILQQTKHKKIILFELLSHYGYNASAIDDLIRCLEEEKTGRQFFSSSHRLILDRYNLILLPRNEEEEKISYYIEDGKEQIEQPLKMKICEYAKTDNFTLNRSSLVAQLDADMLQFPLTMRNWKEGDLFKPLGLNGFKKLSDYFTDKKIRRDQKEQMWLLLSGNDIVWLVGERIDDRYKITAKTKKIVQIEVIENNRAPHRPQ